MIAGVHVCFDHDLRSNGTLKTGALDLEEKSDSSDRF